MALKAVLDSVDDLPEDVKKEYVERDGKFELQVEIGADVGVKTFTDFSRLNGALVKERNDHKAVKDRIALLGDRKVEDVIAQLDRIPELEAAAQGKLDDKQINDLVEGRIKTRLAPVERERDQLKTQLSEASQKIEGYTIKDKTRTIHDAVRKAAIDAKLLPEALDDALLLADRTFEVQDDGRVVVKDNVGFTPGIEPSAWFTDLQSKRGHWWGPSGGGGAGGNRGGGGGTGGNPFTHENWNLTEQGKLVTSDRAKAEQLAKSAGTSIGGMRPPPKK